MKDYSVIGAITVFILALAIIVVAPLLTILAINSLFNVGIAYTFGTWCASFWLTAVFAAKGISRKK